MLNHIVVMGRLTRDPELRRTQSGVSVTSFSVAVDRDVKNTLTGERETDFIDVVAWRSTAEFVTKIHIPINSEELRSSTTALSKTTRQ